MTLHLLKVIVFNVTIASKMTSQTHGIQQLLTAEKRAAEKVGEARKRKFSEKHLFLDTKRFV